MDRQNVHKVISGAGSDKNRALLDTSIKLCRTTYWYKLSAKCFLSNQILPYFQNGGPEFKMATKMHYNVQKLIHLTHSDGSFLAKICPNWCKA